MVRGLRDKPSAGAGTALGVRPPAGRRLGVAKGLNLEPPPQGYSARPPVVENTAPLPVNAHASSATPTTITVMKIAVSVGVMIHIAHRHCVPTGIK
jgi:hypothetical protein